MTDVRTKLRNATAARADAQSAWAALIRAAVESGLTLAEVAEDAGITRGRVSQIVGRTGRGPGRRAK